MTSFSWLLAFVQARSLARRSTVKIWHLCFDFLLSIHWLRGLCCDFGLIIAVVLIIHIVETRMFMCRLRGIMRCRVLCYVASTLGMVLLHAGLRILRRVLSVISNGRSSLRSSHCVCIGTCLTVRRRPRIAIR